MPDAPAAPSSPFLRKLRAALKAAGVRGESLLLAVSGGADSVALLRGSHALAGALNLQLHVAHFNHRLRGAESDSDAAWLEALCGRLEVPFVLESRDVAAAAVGDGTGLEETARELRYEFLIRTAEAIRCRCVAVAHTFDDQAETVLHHILRGTGVAGLRGMPPVRTLSGGIQLIRPLLEISRRDVEAWLREIDQTFREDASNADESFTRNRIRRSLLPLLRRDYNPRVEEALLRLAGQAEYLQETLEAIASRLLDEALADRTGTLCRVNCAVLADQPRHLVRECFSLLWKRQDWPRRRMGFAEWDCLAGLVTQPGTAVFPGEIEARRRNDLLVLRRL